MSYGMGAAGLVSELLEPGREDGARLAFKTDAQFTRTESDATEGMASAEADTWLVRAGIEGSRRFALGEEGAALVPSFEIGVRRDGGDAETGFGADIGGGLAFSAPASGLSLDVSARGLLAHEASDFREWGVAASLGYDPDPSSPLGLARLASPELGRVALGRCGRAARAAHHGGARRGGRPVRSAGASGGRGGLRHGRVRRGGGPPCGLVGVAREPGAAPRPEPAAGAVGVAPWRASSRTTPGSCGRAMATVSGSPPICAWRRAGASPRTTADPSTA